jgi:hypothetical protein
MAGITLAQAEAQLALYLAAEAAVLSNQSYEIAGRKVTRADLAAIQEGIKLWNDRAQQLENRTAGSGRRRTIVPAG